MPMIVCSFYTLYITSSPGPFYKSMTFNDLNLIEPILKALNTEGYTTPTPIQQQAIPYLLEERDLLVEVERVDLVVAKPRRVGSHAGCA